MAGRIVSRLLLSTEKYVPSESVVSADPPLQARYGMVIILGCLVCANICVVGLMALFRCTWVRHHSQYPTVTRKAGPCQCSKREIIKSLPKQAFKSTGDVEEGGDTEECVICMGEFVDGEEIRVLPGCCHKFHVGCIDKWLIMSDSPCCPSCRQALVVADQSLTCRTSIALVMPSPLPPPPSEAGFLP